RRAQSIGCAANRLADEVEGHERERRRAHARLGGVRGPHMVHDLRSRTGLAALVPGAPCCDIRDGLVRARVDRLRLDALREPRRRQPATHPDLAAAPRLRDDGANWLPRGVYGPRTPAYPPATQTRAAVALRGGHRSEPSSGIKHS